MAEKRKRRAKRAPVVEAPEPIAIAVEAPPTTAPPPTPIFEPEPVAIPEPVVEPEPERIICEVERPFGDLCKKHRVSRVEAAGLRHVLGVGPDGLVLETKFCAGRQSWLNRAMN